jgi:hypothetical protein
MNHSLKPTSLGQTLNIIQFFFSLSGIYRPAIGCDRFNKTCRTGKTYMELKSCGRGGEGRRGLTGDPRKTMRWRRSMLVVSRSSRRAFLAAGRAADSPDRSQPAESVCRVPAAADARTVVLRPGAVGARNRADGEEVHGGAVRAAISC